MKRSVIKPVAERPRAAANSAIFVSSLVFGALLSGTSSSSIATSPLLLLLLLLLSGFGPNGVLGSSMSTSSSPGSGVGSDSGVGSGSSGSGPDVYKRQQILYHHYWDRNFSLQS